MTLRLNPAPATPHVIETLQWDCRFARKDQALAQQDRLSRFLKGPGLRIVAEQFERISPPTEVWRIDRLEVDLGRLDAHASFEQWSAQLQEQLWTSLQRLRREGTAGSTWRLLTPEGSAADLTSDAGHDSEQADPAEPEPARALLSPSERDLDVFMHYLQQGYLPWSANLAAARDLADWLTRMALHHGLRLWQRLQQAQPSAQVLQRLCHISPHTGLQALIAVRHPDLAASLALLDRELLAPLHASGRISAYQLRQLQQRYRVAGLHALWGLSGSALSAARHQALQQALIQAHRDWLAPSWNPAWRTSLARAPYNTPGPATGGELARVLLQALLGEQPDAPYGQSTDSAAPQLPDQARADLARLQAVLDGRSPLDSVRLGELLGRLQTLQGPARSRLGHALRMLARHKAQRLSWARQLGAMQVWQLIQLMRHTHPGPEADTKDTTDTAPTPLRHAAPDQPLSEPGSQQAAWLAASSWSESLRQFALRMNSAAQGASRPGLSRLQSQLVGYSLRYLAQHGRLPQDHVAWQELWQQAWRALYGPTPHAPLRARRGARRAQRLVETLQSGDRLDELRAQSGDAPAWPASPLDDPTTALQIHLIEHSLLQAVSAPLNAKRAAPDAPASAITDGARQPAWHAAWQVWQSTHPEASALATARRTPRSLRAELRRRALRRQWRWHVATQWSELRKIELLRMLSPAPAQAEAGNDWAWLPDAIGHAHRLDIFADASAGTPDAAWLWATAIEWAVQQVPGRRPAENAAACAPDAEVGTDADTSTTPPPTARSVQAYWAAQWRGVQGALAGQAPLRRADAPARQLGQIGLHRLRDAHRRWQLVSTATNATLLECLASCLGCPPGRLAWFDTALQAAAQANASAPPQGLAPARSGQPWAHALLWSFSLGLLATDASADTGTGTGTEGSTPDQAARTLIERGVQAHWAALLAVVTQALPQWWRQWSMRQTVRQRPAPRSDLPSAPHRHPHLPADLQADLHADLQARSARYLAAQAWSCANNGGPAQQIETSRHALLRLWPRWVRAWSESNCVAPDERPRAAPRPAPFALPQSVASPGTAPDVVRDRSTHASPTAVPTQPSKDLLGDLLARPVSTLLPAERLQLAELMQTDAACSRWLATHDEAQRWAWLHAQFGHGAATLQRCSAPLLTALRMTCPQLTTQQAHALHWQHLAQHLFVEGLPPEPGMLARRYTLRLCQRDRDLAGAASHSWQRWLHRVHQALLPSSTGTTTAAADGPGPAMSVQTVQTVQVMQEALQAPPRADEQWEASLTPAQRAAPLSSLDTGLGTAAPPADRPHTALAASPRHAAAHHDRAVAPIPGKDPIYTPTAGLVLLGGYVQRAFAALQLTAHSKFVDEAAQARAVHCLEYLAWGTTESAEPDWVLSKMLCGVPLAQPLPPCDALDTATRELLDSLLRAVIEHWKTVGNTSLAGLRQSFLQRAGRLTRKESDLDDQWQLTVEPRAFDMLLDRLPWSYSTIKLPWMAGALYVDWR